MNESASAVYKEYISSLQEQLSAVNAKLDNLQASMTICKDSISALNTNIAENTNYWSVINSPYGAIVICAALAVICVIAIKKGFSISKTGISVGSKKQ